MGYRYADYCYETGPEAEAAAWANFPGSIVPVPGMAVTLTGLSAWETSYYPNGSETPQTTYLIACDDVGPVGAGTAQTFERELFDLGLYGVLTLWATGFAVGLIISVIRKLRNAK